MQKFKAMNQRKKMWEKNFDLVLNNNFLDVTQKHKSQNDKLII